jgi:hypothetical protein
MASNSNSELSQIPNYIEYERSEPEEPQDHDSLLLQDDVCDEIAIALAARRSDRLQKSYSRPASEILEYNFIYPMPVVDMAAD